jgi:hypothetical protein
MTSSHASHTAPRSASVRITKGLPRGAAKGSLVFRVTSTLGARVRAARALWPTDTRPMVRVPRLPLCGCAPKASAIVAGLGREPSAPTGSRAARALTSRAMDSTMWTVPYTAARTSWREWCCQ